MHELASWSGHSFEAWMGVFDLHSPDSIVYTGSDDTLFKVWDIRGESGPVLSVGNKAHDGGVTSIAPSPLQPHVLATGSYDENIRIWDIRALRRQPLHELNLGGGVWRIKWHPSRPDTALVASMYNGFHILDNLGMEAEPRIVRHYQEHDSIAYGVDWLDPNSSSSAPSDWIATCSFYDHLLHVWNHTWE